MPPHLLLPPSLPPHLLTYQLGPPHCCHCHHNCLECCHCHCCHHNCLCYHHCHWCSHPHSLSNQMMPHFLHCMLGMLRTISWYWIMRGIFNWTSHGLMMMLPQKKTQQTLILIILMKMTMTLSLCCCWLRILSHPQGRLILSIVAAAHLSLSWRVIRMICYLNCNILGKKVFLLKLDCHFEYHYIPAKFQLVGKVIAGPNRKISTIEKKITPFNGNIQNVTSVQMTWEQSIQDWIPHC